MGTKPFKDNSAARTLELVMLIDTKGHSHHPTELGGWWSVSNLIDITGIKSLRGNGSTMFQKDRGLGIKYELEKQYDKKPRRLGHIRTIGFSSSATQMNIPKLARSAYANKPCAKCGTTSNIQIDHKDGRKPPSSEDELMEFQPLCQHCNTVKRARCSECKSSNKRYRATLLGYSKPFTIGSDGFEARKPRCVGCYWYDPKDFNQQISANFNKTR